jgi:hypothetical protein
MINPNKNTAIVEILESLVMVISPFFELLAIGFLAAGGSQQGASGWYLVFGGTWY